MLALLLVAASVGLSNLAAAVGIGFAGVSGRTRLRVGLVFGAFESGMPIIGLAAGAGLATGVGQAARWIGAALLIGIGGYGAVRALRQRDPAHPARAADSMGRLVVTAFALSLDNLAAGFALGTFRVGVLLGAIVIGAVSVAMSLAGLEVGRRLGASAGRYSEGIGSVILVGVGIAIAAGALG